LEPSGQQFFGVNGIKTMLNSATLEAGAAPAVKGSDLSILSKTYNEIISLLGLESLTDSGISLSLMTSILEESVSKIHHLLLFGTDSGES
jgi:hypothetical protein